MARMRKRTRSFVTVLAVGVTALTLSMQSASATLNIPSTNLQNNASGDCAIARPSGSAGIGPCGWDDYFRIISAAPDAGGAAYVQIQTTTDDETGPGYCLYAVGAGTGPSAAPAGSSDVELIPCSYNDPRAIWAVARAGATVNGLTPETFFAFDGRVCLDGGYGTLYAFREEGCNGSNAWQRWTVYTG